MDRQPARAKQAEVQSYGTIVISYKDRVQRVSNTEEQDITNALIKVVTGAEKKVYFTQGHGERDTTASDRGGYSNITAALGRDNFSVAPVVIAQQKDVPADATVVIIAGPQDRFSRARSGRVAALRRQGRQGDGDAGSAGAQGGRSGQHPSLPERVGDRHW